MSETTSSTPSNNIHICKDETSFKQVFKKSQLQIVVVHFEADWAPECEAMNTVIAELAKEYIHTVFIRLCAEEVAEVTQHYEVDCVPTCLVFKENKVIDKVEGADAPLLTKVVKFHSTSYVAPVVSSTSPVVSLEERLKGLVKAHQCMLFMKGSPDEPKCGFSREIISILKQNNIKFGHFDILTDNEVRQGLKKFSDWPTYPQLYCAGELVGGLDIIKELSESNELADMLPKHEDLNTRLEKLVKSAPVMIFMKGQPDKPQCKFSRALMEILNKYPEIKFDSFNIFDDEDVRQGLKTFSNWPTFPQIYVDGGLVGGLDIIKQLEEDDELVSTLTSS